MIDTDEAIQRLHETTKRHGILIKWLKDRVGKIEAENERLRATMAEMPDALKERAMGWNDHMDWKDLECQDCGEIDTWEFWNDVAKARYSGALGKWMGLDLNRDGRCPHCGSTNGIPIGDD